MKNALVLHGTGNTPQHNWIPWLQGKLEDSGYKVWVPQLPDCKTPSIRTYNKFLLESDFKFNDETIIIGHSSGAVAVMGLLQALPDNVKISHVVMIAAFIDNLGREELSGLFVDEFDYEKISDRSDKITLLHSDNDQYCPLDHAEFLSKKLNAELIIQPGSNHFSINAGGERFNELPVLLDILDLE